MSLELGRSTYVSRHTVLSQFLGSCAVICCPPTRCVVGLLRLGHRDEFLQVLERVVIDMRYEQSHLIPPPIAHCLIPGSPIRYLWAPRKCRTLLGPSLGCHASHSAGYDSKTTWDFLSDP